MAIDIKLPTVRYYVSWEQYSRQALRAEETMRTFNKYASSIGCTVTGDTITGDVNQAKLLEAWWDEQIKKPT